MRNPYSHIKLIIFDLWQTLVDIPDKPIGGLYEVLSPDVSLEKFIRDLEKGNFFTSDRPIEDQIKVIYCKYSCLGTIDDGLAYWKSISKSAYFLDGALGLMSEISGRYKLILLSDMERFGYEDFFSPSFFDNFDELYLSYKIHKKKPNTSVLIEILEKHSLSPKQVLVVGDSLSKDIIPANALGMPTYHINGPKTLTTLRLLLSL